MTRLLIKTTAKFLSAKPWEPKREFPDQEGTGTGDPTGGGGALGREISSSPKVRGNPTVRSSKIPNPPGKTGGPGTSAGPGGAALRNSGLKKLSGNFLRPRKFYHSMDQRFWFWPIPGHKMARREWGDVPKNRAPA